MSRDDILRMAREVDLQPYYAAQSFAIERFYHLAYAAGEQAERERTARLVADMQSELRQRRMTGRDA
jgi:hypothetical protein